MKKLILGTFSLALIACSAGEADEKLTVTVNYPGAQDQRAELFNMEDGETIKLDSADMIGGKVVLGTSVLEYAQPVFIRIENLRRPLFLYEQEGHVILNATGEGETFDYTQEGGTHSESVNKYFDIQDDFQTNWNAFMQEYQRAQSIGDSITLAMLTEKADQIMTGKTRRLTDLAKSSGAFGAFIAASDIYDGEASTLDSIYTNIPVAQSSAPMVSDLKERIDILKRIQIGEAYVDFAQPDTTGMMVKLSDLKGKYTLIDFWASWCGPCRAENPNVVDAYNKYHDRGFTVVGVSLDENRAAWIAAIEKDGLTWAHMSDLKGWENEAAAQYAVRAIPQNVMLDENGIIVAKNLREEELHEWLEENL